MLIAAGLIANPVAAVAQILRAPAVSRPPTAAMPNINHGVFAVGGMTVDRMAGGMSGGMDGGMTGSGMTGGAMMGGGMAGGGMTGGMGGGGITGMPGALPGNTDLPVYNGVSGDTAGGQSYRTNETNATDSRSRKIYHCVTRHGRCAVDSTFDAPRKGDSCGCLLGGPGKIQ